MPRPRPRPILGHWATIGFLKSGLAYKSWELRIHFPSCDSHSTEIQPNMEMGFDPSAWVWPIFPIYEKQTWMVLICMWILKFLSKNLREGKIRGKDKWKKIKINKFLFHICLNLFYLFFPFIYKIKIIWKCIKL